MSNTATEVVGKVIQVAGPAVDVQFTIDQIPLIYTAIRITSEGFEVPEPISIIVEVAQHIGEGRVRCIALQPTDGLIRGMKAISTGAPITVYCGQTDPGPDSQCPRRTGGPAGSGCDREALPHPPLGAFIRRAINVFEDV